MNQTETFEHLAKMFVSAIIRAIQSHQPQTTTYSARNLPPDINTTRRFNQLAPHCPGAVKMGRMWTVPAAEWARFRMPANPATNVVSLSPFSQGVATDEQIVEQMMTNRKIRKTK